MVYRYTPLLRWKRGERVGLRNTAVSQRQDVTPLFAIAADQYKGKEPNRSRAAVSPADALVAEILNTWGTAPCYVDASGIGHTVRHPHPIADIAASARQHGANVIPATRLSAPVAYQQDVAAVHRIDGKGAALRVDLQGLTSAATWTGSWPIPLADTDLVANFGTNVGTVYGLGSTATQAFQSLHSGNQWRSVTVAGTSMPDNFTGFQAGLHIIDRQEWRFWNSLSAAGLPYRLDYGDYATIPVNSPPPGISWGFPINIRYTLRQEFLICRGVSPTGYGGQDMDVQLISHAQSIRTYPGRDPIPNGWADVEIDGIANQTTGPGNLEKWVQIGVCRHIERVRTDLP